MRTDVSRPSQVLARAVSGGSKVAIIRKGESRNTGSSCARATAGKQAVRHAGPKVSPPEGPYYASTRIPTYAYAHGHLHTILLLDKERDDALHDLPANSHTYIGQTTQ